MELLIVEDSHIQVNQIKETFSAYYPDFSISACEDYDSAIKLINAKPFHIFILDIDLGEGDEKNGIAIAKHIRALYNDTTIPILFLTSFPDKTMTAINDVHCYSFLLKPYSENALKQSISSLLSTNLVPANKIEIKDIYGIYSSIDPKDIIYVEILNHKLLIHTTLDTIPTNSFTIDAFYKRYERFLIKCHKSYAVNPKHICNYSSSEIYVNEKGKTIAIPISRSQKESVLRRLSHE